jgi:hypothetical protein
MYEAQIRQAFAELGWTVTQYGGGSSNVHHCPVDIQSDDRELARPTLIATLERAGGTSGLSPVCSFTFM